MANTDSAATYKKKLAALVKARAARAAKRAAAPKNGVALKKAGNGAAAAPARQPVYAPRKEQKPSLDGLAQAMTAEAARLERRAQNLRAAAVLLQE